MPFQWRSQFGRVWKKMPESDARWRCSETHTEPLFFASSSRLCQNWLQASLSRTFLQTLPELVTSIAFPHLPPNSARTGYKHRFSRTFLQTLPELVTSIAFPHLPPNSARTGHKASLSRTFLQTLPELVTSIGIPAPSSKLCQNWLRASLSRTFLLGGSGRIQGMDSCRHAT